MAIREIVTEGDPILLKKSRPYLKVDEKVRQLLDDMFDTMQHADGLGLAAPQVGILRKAVVIDVGEGRIDLVDPVILEEKGSCMGVEGCLSMPGINGKVERPEYVHVKAMDRDGNEIEYKAYGMLARALCHEIDHLEGVLIRSKIIEYVDDNLEDDE